MGSPRRCGTQGAVRTARRGSGFPLLSCAVVLLLSAPAVAAQAPGVRVVPRPAASPGADGFGAWWGDRPTGRTAGLPGEEQWEATPGAPLPLPLPPLFGHHRERERPQARRPAGHGEQTGARTRPGRAPAGGAAAGERGVPEHGAPTPPEVRGGTDDAARGSAPTGHPGGDSTGGARTPGDPTGAPSGSNPAPPRPGASPGGSDGPDAADDLWSPAPVASEDAGAGAAEPGPPQAGPPQREASGSRTDEPGVPAASEVPVGPLLPVLPLGAGLTSLGLGLAFLALRLRRG